MTIQELLEQFEKEFQHNDGCIIVDKTEAIDWLRTHLTTMFNKDEAFQHGFMSGYKAGRESYETQMKLQKLGIKV